MEILRLSKSFVIHGITGNFKGRVSAWFEENGTVTDAEQFNSKNIARPVKRGGPIWQKLERIGQAWKTKAI